jgi:ribose 1,5-bisphosphokinase PhnN
MTDYAIVQVARAIAPAVGVLGVGGIAVGLAFIFRNSQGKRTRKTIEDVSRRLERIERLLQAGRDASPSIGDAGEIQKRLETLETIVVDRELSDGSRDR